MIEKWSKQNLIKDLDIWKFILENINSKDFCYINSEIKKHGKIVFSYIYFLPLRSNEN